MKTLSNNSEDFSQLRILIRARLIAAVALGAMSLWFAGCTLALIPVRVFSGWTHTIMEAQPVYAGMKVAAGNALYEDYRTASACVPLTYGPLEYVIPGWLARGIHSRTADRILLIGRLQSIAGLVLTGIMVVLLSISYGAPRRTALAALLPLFWFPFIAEWYSDFAPDAMALGLSLAGWWVATIRSARLKPIAAYAAALVWVLAFYFKPTILAGPIAFCVVEIAGSPSEQRWPRAFPIMLFVLALVTSATALQLFTHGSWLRNQFGSQAGCQYNPEFILEALKQLTISGVCALTILTLYGCTQALKPSVWRGFVAVAALDTLLMLKQGSNAHYLMEAVAIGAVALACEIQPVRPNESVRSVIVQTIALSGIALSLVAGYKNARVLLWEGVLPSADEITRISNITREDPSVLALEPFFGLQQHKKIAFADSYHASMLEKQIPSLTDISAEITARKYAHVIVNRFWLNPAAYQGQLIVPVGIQHALFLNYEIETRGWWLVLLRPKPRP